MKDIRDGTLHNAVENPCVWIMSFKNILDYAHHLSLSLAPAEKVELFKTSPISSLQKLKLLMAHMYENLMTLTWKKKVKLKAWNGEIY